MNLKEKDPDFWKEKLDLVSFRVCRLGETEPAFSGALLYVTDSGTYHCKCCDRILFDSSAKFESGCGWPSFDKSKTGAIRYLEDHSHGMLRTEIRCAHCDSHLGHVFDDGPTESGQRYCVNSVAMTFEQQDEKA